MKKEFPGYFANRIATSAGLWDECLFVLDANVLLSLYRYSDATRQELLQVFSSLAPRLWVPHQVIDEYLRNRLTVIGDQMKVYDDAVRKISDLRKSLESQNQSPFVSADILLETISLFSRLDDELNVNKKVHESRIGDDEIKDALEVLLEGRVGDGYDKEKLKLIIDEGKLRYEERIPPGFGDIKKGGDSTLFSDRCKPYGDYIVWLQLLEQAKVSSQSVIFVTGDVKEDWWERFHGKTVGPRPELVQEFYNQTGKDFFMYTPDRFLEKANEHLQRAVSQKAVDEIRDVRVDDSESPSELLQLGVKWATYSQAERRAERDRLSLVAGRANSWNDTGSRNPEALSYPWNDDEYVKLTELRARYAQLSDKRQSLSDDYESESARRKTLKRRLSQLMAMPDYDQDAIKYFHDNLENNAGYMAQLQGAIDLTESQMAPIKREIDMIVDKFS